MFSCLSSISTGNHDNMSGHMNEINLDVTDFYKNIKKENKKEKTIEDIAKLRNSPWIISKKRLKKLVKEEVVIRDTVKNIII